jgi:hypothetical protein
MNQAVLSEAPSASPVFSDDQEQAALAPYKAVSRMAVVSAVLATVSLLGLMLPAMLVLAAAGAICGLVALRTIARYPDEFTGRPVALAGLWGGTLIFILGASWHTFVFATELPPNHERLYFSELQPDSKTPFGQPVPDKALQMSGKKVLVKGYIHPSVSSMGKVDHFVLVPDMGTCCFGGPPKPTDMIEVKVTDPKYRVKYAIRRIKLTGTFTASTAYGQSHGLDGVVYHLEADTVQ